MSTTPLKNIILEIASELERATKKFPTWPTDPIHAASVVMEEAGELAKEVNQLSYEPHKSSKEAVRAEAMQTAAMAIRFLLSMDRYDFTPGPQHDQKSSPERNDNVPPLVEKRGEVWMMSGEDCQSCAREVAEISMRTLGIDVTNFRLRDAVITEIADTIGDMLDAASNAPQNSDTQ